VNKLTLAKILIMRISGNLNKLNLTQVLALLACLVAGYIGLKSKLAQSERAFVAGLSDDNAELVLYLASPVERRVLDSVKKLWPETFNEKHPPAPEDMPELFTFIERNPYEFSDISPEMLAQARLWSYLLNAGHSSTFLSMLNSTQKNNIEKLSAWPSGWKVSPACHFLRQELAFRLVQADAEKYRTSALKFLGRCDAENPVTLWQEAKSSNDPAQKLAIQKKFKVLSLKPGTGPYSRWLSEEFFKVEFLTSIK
jgi:hypothetical protein